jgi:glucose/arabinose dehydrogenase
MRSTLWPALLAVALLVVAGCTSSDDDVPAGALPPADHDVPAGATSLSPLPIAELGQTATALVAHPTEPILLAARRSGTVYRIRLVDEDGHLVPRLDPEPVLDLEGTVTTDGERGLLDLAFAPAGDELYVSYTDPDGAVTVARYPFDPERAGVAADDPHVVARVEHPYAGHNGGDLEWWGDTLLWSLGDEDLTSTEPPAAQDPTTPLGSVVALDVGDPTTTWTADDLVGDRAVAVGLRNPWRMHVDPATDTLLIGDVGEDAAEEIDTVDLDAPGPAPNFGWPYREGTRVTDLPQPPRTDFTDPLLERPHADDVCAIVAGVPAPPGPAAGRFLFGDNCSGEVQALDLDTTETTAVAEVEGGIVAFAAGTHDDVYALGITGTIVRLDPPGWDVDPPEQPAVAPPPDPTGTVEGTATLPPDQFQAVCDVRAAFADLQRLPERGSASFQEIAEQAATNFEAAAADLPAQVDAATLDAVIGDVLAVGRATGWSTTDPAFTALFADVTAAAPPYQDFPDAMATVVDLGAAC